jgi:hypothetical protein
MFFLSFPARTAPPSRILVLPETFVGMKRAGGQGSQFLPSRARCRRVCSVSAISATPSPVLPSSTREANGGAPTGNGAGGRGYQRYDVHHVAPVDRADTILLGAPARRLRTSASPRFVHISLVF